MSFHYSYILNILVDILRISKPDIVVKLYHMILVASSEFATTIPHGDVVDPGVVNHFSEGRGPAPSGFENPRVFLKVLGIERS